MSIGNQNINNLPAEINSKDHNGLMEYDARYHRVVEGDDEIDLRQLWRTVMRFKRMIISIFLLFLTTALVISLLLRPTYTSSTLLEINTSGRNLVKFQSLEDTDSNAREFMVTQSNLLKSDAVADEVVEKINLSNEPEFNGELRQRGLLTGLKSILALISPKEEHSESDDDVGSLVQTYQSKLAISPVRNSSLIKVSFSSFDPELSAKVANAHSQAYIELNDQRRFQSTSGAKAFLEKEISNVQAKLETSEKELTAFARKHGVIDVEDRNNIMMTRMSELNRSLAEVQNSRIGAETQYLQGQSDQANQVSSVGEDSVVLQLREQQAQLQAEYNEKSRIFKAKYPAMVQLKAKIDELQSSINRQVSREESKVQVGLESRFKQITAHEIRLRAAIESLKQEMLNLQDRAVTYNILKREWEANKELYSGLLERTKEVGVAAGMELNVASVVDTAKPSKAASSPNIPLNVAIGGLLGLLAGLGAAFLLAMLDNSVNDVEQLTQITNLPHLGILPYPDDQASGSAKSKLDKKAAKKFRNEIDLDIISQSDPSSQFSESIQSLKTSLSFSKAGGMPKSLMITSSMPGEGKSTIATNLAITLAKSGKNVILLEADLRKSRHYKVFGVPSSPGVSDKLVDFDSKLQTYKIQEIEGLTISVAGTRPPNPVELLGSTNMQKMVADLEQQYDVVLIDCPPVIGLADAIIVSKIVQGVVFVVGAHHTPQDAIKNSLKRLAIANAPLLGTVLNKVKSDLAGYSYDYYSYYGIEGEDVS